MTAGPLAWQGHLDAARCQVDVLTFKEGVLSAVAHDLRLRVQQLAGEVGRDTVRVRIGASSLRVVCARADGKDAPATLSAADRDKIEATLRGEVLEAGRFPEIAFEASPVTVGPEAVALQGTLALHGVTRPLAIELRREGDAWVAEVPLHQPDFGIRPYRAMLGALKVKPAVRVAVRFTAGPGASAGP